MKLYHNSKDTKYTFVITPGDIDYTPEVTVNITGKYGAVYENSESPVLSAGAEVLRPEEGKLTYQWYYLVLPDNVYVPDYVALDKYVKLEGANRRSILGFLTDSVF